MTLEVLFEKIRKEEVVLWIGAGFSKYAGMPSSRNLKEKIIKELIKYSPKESDNIYKDLPLKNVAENFVKACSDSRNNLNKLLRESFGRKATDSQYHDILSRLPYFKTIITTNYDSLIEDSFQNRCNIVRNDSDLAYINSKVPTIIKLHGDLQSFDKIVITERDYSQTDNFNNLIWNYIKSLTTHKDVLFVGYGYEDSNVWYLFEKLNNVLGHHARQKILITPSIEDAKKNSLIRERIEVLNLTGEEFILNLEQNVIDNILSDLREGITSVDTLKEYLKYRDLSSIIKCDNDRVFVEQIKNSKGEIDLKVNFTLDSVAFNEFQKFNRGETDELEYKITDKGFLDFSVYNFGLKDYLSRDNVKEIIVRNIGSDMLISIERNKADITFDNLIAKRYLFEKKTIVKINVGDYILKLIFEFGGKKIKTKFEFSFCDVATKISENQKLFEMLLGSSEDDPVIFHVANKHKISFGNFRGEKELNNALENLRLLYTKLRKIEQASGTRFEEIDLNKLTKEVHHQIDFLYKMITNGFFVENNEQKAIPIKDETLRQMFLDANSSNSFNGGSVIAVVTDKPIYELFSKKLNFGFLSIKIIEAFISHKEDGKSFMKSKKGKFVFKFHESLEIFNQVVKN